MYKNKKLLYLLGFGIILFLISLFDTSKESTHLYSTTKIFTLIIHFIILLLITYIIIKKNPKKIEIHHTKWLKQICLFITIFSIFLYLTFLKSIKYSTIVKKSSFLIIFLILTFVTFLYTYFEYKSKDYSTVLIVLFSIFTISILILYGIERSSSLHYIPFNNDFQTYNGIRRLLSGQTPYKDFVFYLGLGPLYSTSFFVKLIGNSFMNSLFTTTFLSYLFSAITITFILYLILKNIKISISTTFLIFFLQFINREFDIAKTYYPNIYNFLNPIYTTAQTGHSYRPARSFIIILAAIILYLVLEKQEYIKQKTKNLPSFLKAFLIGVFAATLILWSNDFGNASYIAFSFIFFLVILKSKNLNKITIGILSYIIGTLISIFCTISILTKGHFTSWLKATLGTADFQSWYYGSDGYATYFYKNLNHSLFIIAVIGLILCLTILHIKNKRIVSDNLVIIFLSLSYLIAAYLYQIFSYETALFSYLNSFGTILVLAFILKLINNFLNKYISFTEIYSITVFLIILLSIFLLGAPTIYFNYHKGVYNEKLQGYLPEYSTELNTLINYTQGAQVFSTFASAYETITDQFQPTRYDYIIHVLGEEARKEYITDFKNGEYQYVFTISKNYTPWQDWTWYANWFFYRELYQNYQPTYEIGYNNIWEPSTDNSISLDNTTISYKYLSPDRVKISINSQNKSHLIADIKLSYSTNIKHKNLDPLRTLLFVDLNRPEKEVQGFNLPSISEEYFIPIEVINGYGSVILDLRPNGYGTIDIHQIELINLFPQSLNNIQPFELTKP